MPTARSQERRRQELDGEFRVGAFQKMAVAYGVTIKDEVAGKIVKSWRQRHQKVYAFWKALETAAFEAVAKPGEAVRVRGVIFKVSGSFLWCRLPSGRVLCYPYPALAWKEMPWTDDDDNPVRKQVVSFKGVNSYTRKWETLYSYGGKWAENITQAAARDVMADAMLRVEANGYPVVLTVHDEVVCEVEKGFGSTEEFESLMTVLPTWANGLPVAAEAWSGERYQK